MLFYRGNMNIYLMRNLDQHLEVAHSEEELIEYELRGHRRIPRAQWRQLKREQKEAKAKRKAEAEELLSHYQVMTVPEFLGLPKE